MARQRNVYGWEIREQLLHGKEATPLAPWLQTYKPLPAQARRREGPAPWAVPLDGGRRDGPAGGCAGGAHAARRW